MNGLFKDVGVVLLSAGRGTRLNCEDNSKSMLKIGERPLLSYIIETLEKASVPSENIFIVVGFCKEKIMEYFGARANYVEQAELLGTAHAAYLGIKAMPQNLTAALTLNGDDCAFYKWNALENLVRRHKESKAVLSLLSVESDSPEIYGRVARHNGFFEIIEKEYLTEEQKKIKEISTGTFCLERFWFEKIFPTMRQMKKLGKFGEYGLPAAVAIANNESAKTEVIKLEDNQEWFGINTPAELIEANKRKVF